MCAGVMLPHDLTGELEVRDGWDQDPQDVARRHRRRVPGTRGRLAGNPNTLVVARGDRARAQRMTESGARFAKLGRRYSHVLVAEDQRRVVGVLNALEWPDCQLRVSEKLKIAPSMIRVTGLGLPRAFTMMSVWAKHDPRARHWHMGPIGVHPERQGRGVGTALLAAFLDMADARGSPAYLETDVDRNVALR